jgi:hypothetical protein
MWKLLFREWMKVFNINDVYSVITLKNYIIIFIDNSSLYNVKLYKYGIFTFYIFFLLLSPAFIYF